MARGGQVLVVDDEPAIRALVAKIVERTGLSVETAADGEDAIAKLRQRDYVVMVLDMMMPRVDGLGVVEFLRQRPGHRPAVIMISAGDPVELRKLDPSIVHSIVRKPFDINVLADLVEAAVASLGSTEQRDESGRVVDFRRSPAS